MFTSLRPAFAALALMLSAGTVTAQAAIVTSTDHYQKFINLACGSGSTFCTGNFPAPGSKHRLHLTRMTCILDATAGSTFNLGEIDLLAASDALVLEEFLTGVYSGNGTHSLNDAIDVQVGSSQHIYVVLGLASGTVNGGHCTAAGTLDTLQ